MDLTTVSAQRHRPICPTSNVLVHGDVSNVYEYHDTKTRHSAMQYESREKALTPIVLLVVFSEVLFDDLERGRSRDREALMLLNELTVGGRR